MQSDWNRIADADLAAMLADGWTIEAIADALDRPKEAVEARRKDLGLDSLPQPKSGLFGKKRQRLPMMPSEERTGEE
jgi:hypothetical protein